MGIIEELWFEHKEEQNDRYHKRLQKQNKVKEIIVFINEREKKKLELKGKPMESDYLTGSDAIDYLCRLKSAYYELHESFIMGIMNAWSSLVHVGSHFSNIIANEVITNRSNLKFDDYKKDVDDGDDNSDDDDDDVPKKGK